MNVTKVCNYATDGNAISQGCWKHPIKWLDGSERIDITTNGQRTSWVLADGTMVLFTVTNDVFIHVNGDRCPNTVGKDIFVVDWNPSHVTRCFETFCASGSLDSTEDPAYVIQCPAGTCEDCSAKYLME